MATQTDKHISYRIDAVDDASGGVLKEQKCGLEGLLGSLRVSLWICMTLTLLSV